MSGSILEAEADAFDSQIDERIRNGHVPDLRRASACDWFCNNPWRRPEYVELEFHDQFEVILDAIRDHCSAERPRVLEVGCGPGYLSLELARNGLEVVGLDLSPRCIDVSRSVAAEDPWISERAPLEYIVGDFLTSPDLSAESFDSVVFLGSLHHFPDQAGVARRVRELVGARGLIVVYEPARDRVSRGTAAFQELLEGVLSAGGNFYRDLPLPSTDEEYDAAISRRYDKMKYEEEGGGTVQSENDNSAGFVEMSEALRSNFEELSFEWRYAFFHEFIGGLRFDDETNVRLARFLREMDRRLVALDVLDASLFFFVGRVV